MMDCRKAGAVMINVNELDRHTLDIIYGAYHLLQLWSDEEPTDTSASKQRKLYRRAKENYTLEHELSDELKNYLFKELNAHEALCFMRECHKKSEELTELHKTEFAKNAVGLSSEVVDALWTNTHPDFYPTLLYRGNDVIFVIEDHNSYDQLLILRNIGGTRIDPAHHVWASEATIEFSNGLYYLRSTIRNDENDSFVPAEITFADAEILLNVYNCTDCLFFCDNAWDYLCGMANEIVSKASLSEDLCNAAELELIPLLKEIKFIQYSALFEDVCEDGENYFPNFTAYAEKLECPEIVSLLEKLEKERPGSKRHMSVAQQIQTNANEPCGEAMLRALFDEIGSTQTDYPHKAHALSGEEIENVREIITQKLAEHGFSGSYPIFTAQGDKASFLIHCTEAQFYNVPHIDFSCCTSLIENDDKAYDVYSFLFNNGKKRLLRSVSHSFYSEECNSLEEDIDIAVKNVHTLRLTTADRLAHYSPSEFTLFLHLFIFAGGLFAIFMTIGFILIEFVITLLLGKIGWFPELFMDTPWWLVFISCWILFGGIYGLYMLSTNK